MTTKYGYRPEGEAVIVRDGALLATLTDLKELSLARAGNAADDRLWKKFKKAGGDTGAHTGWSWGCVRREAYLILSKQGGAA